MINVSLKNGLLLENLGRTLPWGANYFELREIGRPEIRKVVGRWGSPTSYHLVWRNATILGGINTVVATEVRGPRTVLARYYRKRMAYVRNYIDHSKFPTARRAYRWHLSMLTRRLGAPVLTGDSQTKLASCTPAPSGCSTGAESRSGSMIGLPNTATSAFRTSRC